MAGAYCLPNRLCDFGDALGVADALGVPGAACGKPVLAAMLLLGFLGGGFGPEAEHAVIPIGDN